MAAGDALCVDMQLFHTKLPAIFFYFAIYRKMRLDLDAFHGKWRNKNFVLAISCEKNWMLS